MPRLTALFSNLLLLVGGEVAARLVSFTAIAYLARSLGTHGFGMIAFAAALIAYFSLGASLGLDLYGAREVARRPDAVAGYVVRIQSLRLLLAGGCYAVLAGLTLALPLLPELRVVVLLQGLSLFALAGSPGWAFQGLERMAALAVAGLLGQMALLAGVLLFVRTPGDVSLAPLTFVAAEATATLVLVVLFARDPGPPRTAQEVPSWRQSLGQALPLFVGKAMRTLGMTFDILALTFYLGESSVGVYSAASRIVLFVLTLNALYFTNLYPTLARAVTWEPAALQVLFARSVRLTAVIAVPIGVGGAVLAAEIVTAVFGPDYGGAAAPFRILSATVAVTVISWNYRNLLIAFNHQRTDTGNIASGALVNVLLNLLLIPRLGATGAAIASVAGDSLTLILGNGAVSHLVLREGFLRHLVRPVAASLAMAAALVSMPAASLFLKIGAGGLVYAIAILALRGTSPAELKAIVFRPEVRSPR